MSLEISTETWRVGVITCQFYGAVLFSMVSLSIL